MADFTAADLTAINTAIKSGTLSVAYRDRNVTYRSLSEMRQIRDMIKEDLGENSAFEDRSRQIAYDRGLDS